MSTDFTRSDGAVSFFFISNRIYTNNNHLLKVKLVYLLLGLKAIDYVWKKTSYLMFYSIIILPV